MSNRHMGYLLEKLFESPAKVRVLRLFVRNPEETFSFPDIAKRTQVKRETTRKELGKLIKIGLIKRKVVKKIRIYFTNSEFRLLSELQNLIIKDAVAPRKELLAKAKRLGNVKLIILSGVFINSDQSRTDMLIVGDGVKKSKLEKFLADIESELGRPLRYTVMDSNEFKYRKNMYDRFLRDIFESPHEKLINKMKVQA